MGSFTRFVACLVVVAVAVASCDSSSQAPPVGDVGEACAETSFCIGVPQGWSVTDSGEFHVTIEHTSGADATVGFVEMDRVVENTGGVWPQPHDRVVRSLWALFDGGDADLDQITVNDDGTLRSVGEISGGVQYHLLVPLGDSSSAVGVVVRVPSRSWRLHTDAVFDGLRLM